MVTAQSIIPTANAEHAVCPAETQERPRWASDAVWQTAKQEARDLGYTGRDVYRQATDLLSDRYGY